MEFSSLSRGEQRVDQEFKQRTLVNSIFNHFLFFKVANMDVNCKVIVGDINYFIV